MSTLRRAIEIAEHAHRGQVREGGAAFITHPEAVARALSDDGAGTRLLQVAWLHDTVEDTEWTLDDLRHETFHEDVVVAVDALTRRDGEPYFDYLARLAQNPDARRVKLHDMRHNLSTLVDVPEGRRASQTKRYEKGLAFLADAETAAAA